MDFLLAYGLFLLQLFTVVGALAILIALAMRQKMEAKGQLQITKVGDSLKEWREALQASVLNPAEQKIEKKKQKRLKKQQKKSDKKVTPDSDKKRHVYLLDFIGDAEASANSCLRKEISAILTIAQPEDEVILRLESLGGYTHTYGLAASQLERIKRHGCTLTICVDTAAASGGYMMACVADKILAAPFAIIGSIGVVLQMPNFYRLLKKNDIDYEQLTAGEYKRTLSVFGENTDAGRAKVTDELNVMHGLFQSFIKQHRPQVDLATTATGEHWQGLDALKLDLVDELMTSDEYIEQTCKAGSVLSVRWVEKKSVMQKMSEKAEALLKQSIQYIYQKLAKKL